MHFVSTHVARINPARNIEFLPRLLILRGWAYTLGQCSCNDPSLVRILPLCMHVTVFNSSAVCKSNSSFGQKIPDDLHRLPESSRVANVLFGYPDEVNILFSEIRMNVKYTLIGAMACAVIVSGCATTENGPEAVYYSSGASSTAAATPDMVPKTRREVKSELAQAYRQGTLHPVGEDMSYPYVPPCTAQKAWEC